MSKTYLQEISGKCEKFGDTAETLDWGFRVIFENEIDALRFVYIHRNNKYGTELKKCATSGFYVTVFNEFGKKLGFC
jgi:hypothetical protein